MAFHQVLASKLCDTFTYLYKLTFLEPGVKMGVCHYFDFSFHASFLSCLHTFWLPSLHLFTLFSCFYTFLVLISVTVRPKSKEYYSQTNDLSSVWERDYVGVCIQHRKWRLT